MNYLEVPVGELLPPVGRSEEDDFKDPRAGGGVHLRVPRQSDGWLLRWGFMGFSYGFGPHAQIDLIVCGTAD